MKTIYALASAQGRAGVAVLRVSGPKAEAVFSTLCRPALTPSPKKAILRSIHDPETGDLLDKALLLWFPSPASFTGEDVVEIQCHGGRAVLDALFSALRKIPDFAPAGPGDFSRRAFENGKMDLTEIEAIADLVEAETAAQRKQALRQMNGDLGKMYGAWADRLKACLAYLEASIDFADEDLPQELADDQKAALQRLADEIKAHLNDHQRGERLRNGFMVALLGPPNAGKSSLLNALAGRDAAIVSSIPGTTRDVIEIALDLKGWPVTLADTAGLRESAEHIENEGIRRALARAEMADIKIAVFDGERPIETNAHMDALLDQDTIRVVNKAELQNAPVPTGFLGVSAKTGLGLDALVDEIVRIIETRFGITDQPSLTRARHRSFLEDCLAALERSLQTDEDALRTEDVRLALRSLGKITGFVDVEDLLDLIFSQFCIGK